MGEPGKGSFNSEIVLMLVIRFEKLLFAVKLKYVFSFVLHQVCNVEVGGMR